jgi:voltage-gated potassium channel
LVLAATLALVPVLILEADGSGGWLTAAYVANWAIWALFAVELAAVLVVAERKRAALRSHWLDAAVVVLTVPVLGHVLASLRLVRLARLLRLLRVATIVSRAIQAEKRLTSGEALRIAALMTVFVVVVAGAAQATFDAGEFAGIWDGVWWATVTVTTVGYGDLYPKTVAGRLIGMLVMFVGIGFLSVLTATVASRFVLTDNDNAELLESLRRIERELTALKARLPD